MGAQYSYYVAESVSLVLGAGYTKTSLRADKALIAGAIIDPMLLVSFFLLIRKPAPTFNISLGGDTMYL